MNQASKDLDKAQVEAREELGQPMPLKKMPVTKPISEYLKKKSPAKYPLQGLTQRKIDFEIMVFLARCNLPFSLVDELGFIEYGSLTEIYK